jgi:hypothetical protein
MADLSRQARHPMTIVSADAAYCYDRVNHVIMFLVWLVLTNGNIPAIVVAIVCLQTIKFFQCTGFGESKSFFGGPSMQLYMMGLGQGNRAGPPLWIQLSSVLINVFKQLNLGALIQDPITVEMILSMGTLFVDDMDLYMWCKEILNPGDLWCQTQLELEQWSCLLNSSGGALKPEKCFWYVLNYECKDREWTYVDTLPRELSSPTPTEQKARSSRRTSQCQRRH